MKNDFEQKSDNPTLIELLKTYSSTSELDLSNSYYIRIDTIKDAFKINSKFKTLNLSKNHLNKAFCVQLSEFLRTKSSLEKLNLSFLKSLNEKGFLSIADALKTNSTLQVLDLSGNNLSEKAIEALAQALKYNSSLKELYPKGLLDVSAIRFHHLIEEALPEADNKSFAGMVKTEIDPSLTELDMSERDYLDIEELAIIEEALKKNANLNMLNISGNSLSKTMGIQVGEALKLNSSLRKLKMSRMGDVDEEGFFAIADALKNHPSLKILDLSNNWGIKGVAIGKILKENSSLEVIDLGMNEDECCGGNGFGKEECEAIGEALKINHALKELNLSNNGYLKDEGVHLAEALKINSTLRVLKLSHMCLGDADGIAFAEALKANSTLESLDLSDNSMHDEGGIALAVALKENSSLKNLNLSLNHIDEDTVIAFGEALKINSTLKSLNLSFNTRSQRAIEVIEEALQNNPSLSVDLSTECEI